MSAGARATTGDSTSPLVLGIDASTTACKAIAWDLSGRAVAEGRARLELHNPAPDAYEQDAESWWRALRAAVGDATGALEAAQRGSAARIRALAIAHQRETVVLVRRDGTPLAPALVWMDARCAAEVRRAQEQLGTEHLHLVSGKPPCTTPSMYKVMFQLGRQRPELAAQRPMLAEVHAFLLRRLVGRWVTSVASADPTGLIDMRRGSWSQELVSFAGLSIEQLPELVAPGTPVGTISASIANSCGLDPEVVVVAGAGDGQAAGLGAGLDTQAEAYLNLGTAMVSGVLCKRYETSPAFRTLNAALPDHYLLETDLKGGTFTLDWLARLVLGEGRSQEQIGVLLDQLEAAARELPPGAAKLAVLPYWNGVMNPFWDDDASGAIVGLRGHHGPAHLYRAIIEGIALEQRLHTEGVERARGLAVDRVRVMGGGSSSALWCSILADVLARPVVRCASKQATSLGAAVLAAWGAGLFESATAAAKSMTSVGEGFTPSSHQASYEAIYRSVYRHLFPALRDVQRALAEIET